MGVAASGLAHVVFIAVLVSATQRTILLRAVPTTQVQIVRDWPTFTHATAVANRRKWAALPRGDPGRVGAAALLEEPALAPLTPAPTSSPSQRASSDGSGEDERRELASALRGSVGCAQARFNGLSASEQQHCRDRFATASEGVHDEAALGIDPIKRAAYDASWTADHSPQHMAGMACVAVFGKGGLKWLHPSEGVKLGPLPCYIYTPKATFAVDPDHARGW